MEDRPVPEVNDVNRAYWEAARRDELLLPKCTACGDFFFPPRRWCPHCFSSAIGWQSAAGLGSIVSYSKLYIAPFAGYAAAFPYVLALVKLLEGPQLMSNIVNGDPDAIRIGAAVRVIFEERAEGVKVPQFELI